MRVIRIGLLGCGVVGTGVLELLRSNAEQIESRLGGRIEIAAIGVRDGTRPRGSVVPRDRITLDLGAVVEDPSIDVIVELIGGLDPARALVLTAIEKRKHVVTANKALLAESGNELLELAEERHVDLYFEGAVAGGVPILRVLREALASDRVLSIRGIVNGTSNYILSRMTEAHLESQAALKAAQQAGYAEAEPTLDISGADAAHKLTILATLAFGARVRPSEISVDGIESVAAADILFADRFGYIIKPLAIGRALETQELDLRVHPALLRKTSTLSGISGALNAIQVEGAALGTCVLSGPGAGALPTAMSVVSDLVDVGRNLLVDAHGRVPSRAFPGAHLRTWPVRSILDHCARRYLRFTVRDRPGVLARIAGALAQLDVSIEQLVQTGRGSASAQPVDIAMLTHEATDRSVRSALETIAAFDDVVEPARHVRVEET